MILSFKSRSLRQFYEADFPGQIPPDMRDRIRKILAFLNRAEGPKDMRIPQWNPHPLKGDRKGQWAIRVSGNWRITFRFVAGGVGEVDLVDYH